VLRVIRESAHLRIAAVIYRQQFTGFRIRVPHQWRSGQALRVCRVVHQPHRRKADKRVDIWRYRGISEKCHGYVMI
ncbi:hypothetical protein ACOII7_004009, partial [Escherichia coli]